MNLRPILDWEWMTAAFISIILFETSAVWLLQSFTGAGPFWASSGLLLLLVVVVSVGAFPCL